MSIVLPEFPRSGMDALISGIAKLPPDGPVSSFVRSVPENRLFVTVPHRVYSIVTPAPLRFEDSNALACVGWRAILQDDETPIAFVDFTTDSADPQVFRLVGFNTGPFLETFASTLRIAETILPIPDVDFELRSISLPALYLSLIWFRNLSDGLDFFTIVPSAAHEFGSQQALWKAIFKDSPSNRYPLLDEREISVLIREKIAGLSDFDDSPDKQLPR